MGSKLGVEKRAANRLGVSFEEWQAHRAAGEKWCTTCKTWLPVGRFARDASRGDGLGMTCKACDFRPNRPGPTLAERAEKRAEGLGWCRRCEGWRTNVYKGLCKPHRATFARELYAKDPSLRFRRIQHANAHKRDMAPLTAEMVLAVRARYGTDCYYCGRPADTWDHVIPVALGGQTETVNLVPACRHCNSSKKARLP